MSSIPRVFIIHSHMDRQLAVEIESLLRQNGAETFLDQRSIEVGDVLSETVDGGIEWCSLFLLLWSGSAALSDYVHAEWNSAYDKRKKIIPLNIDGTSLPTPLDNLVYVDSDDRNLAYSKLLTAIFGREFTGPVGTIFAGTWDATFEAFGVASGTAVFELRRNGQIVGQLQIAGGGLLGRGVQGMGLGNLLNRKFPFTGSWTYELGTQILEMNTTATAFGNQANETIRIMTSPNPTGPMEGQDLSGRT